MPRALLRSVADAPGKFAVVNIALAGSLVSTPKLIVGTSVWALYVSVTQLYFPPKLSECAPRVQLKVSVISRIRGLRRVGADMAVGPLIPAPDAPAAAIPVALVPVAPPRLNPV